MGEGRRIEEPGCRVAVGDRLKPKLALRRLNRQLSPPLQHASERGAYFAVTRPNCQRVFALASVAYTLKHDLRTSCIIIRKYH